jgi:hypothetical protein
LKTPAARPCCSRRPRNGTSTVDRAPICAHEIHFDTNVAFTIIATKNTPRFEAVLQKLGFAEQVHAALDGQRSGGRAAHNIADLSAFDPSASATTMPSAWVMAWARSQINCSTSARMKRSVSNKSRSEAHPRGHAPVSYLLAEFGEGQQCAQGFLARNRFEDAVALLQWRASGRPSPPLPSQRGLD